MIAAELMAEFINQKTEPCTGADAQNVCVPYMLESAVKVLIKDSLEEVNDNKRRGICGSSIRTT